MSRTTNSILSFLARLACVTCAVFAWGTVLQTPLLATAALIAGAYLFYKADAIIIGGKEDAE